MTEATEAGKAEVRAWLVGGGIGSLAAAAFMIRDGGVRGANITILEEAPVLGGSLDGAGDAASGYSMRGGRMLTTDNYPRPYADPPTRSPARGES